MYWSASSCQKKTKKLKGKQCLWVWATAGKQNPRSGLSSLEKKTTEELAKYSAIKHLLFFKKKKDSKSTTDKPKSSPLLQGHILLQLEQKKNRLTLFWKCGLTEVRIGSGRTICYLTGPCLT